MFILDPVVPHERMSQSSGTRERDYTVDHRPSDREKNVHATWDASIDPPLLSDATR